MPIPGTYSAFGQAVPLHGESEIRQSSDAQEDMVTIVGCSGNSNPMLVCRSYVPRESVSSATEVFKIDSSGALAQFKLNVETLSTTSSAVTIYASQSGAFFVDPGYSSAATVTLPAPGAGLFYSVYIGGKSASSQTIYKMGTTGTMVWATDSAADSMQMGKTSALAVGAQCWFFSDGSKWYPIYMPGYSSVTPTSNAGFTAPQVGS